MRREENFNSSKAAHWQKENEIFLIYKEIQMGAVAKSYMRKGFLIYEEMRKYLTKYEDAVCARTVGSALISPLLVGT
jgi:hypothetical protein